MNLKEKHIIDMSKLKRKIKLTENKNEDVKTIHIENDEDIIDSIHYLLNILQKDLIVDQVVNDVMDFETIYNESKKS